MKEYVAASPSGPAQVRPEHLAWHPCHVRLLFDRPRGLRLLLNPSSSATAGGVGRRGAHRPRRRPFLLNPRSIVKARVAPFGAGLVGAAGLR